MESRAERTLMKSAPELWELADDLARMEAWTSDLTGSPHPARIEVAARDPERLIAWRVTGNGSARVAIELAEKTFGTAVSITAELDQTGPGDIDAFCERLLDELGTAERRPFERA
jgi:hypothetical protein